MPNSRSQRVQCDLPANTKKLYDTYQKQVDASLHMSYEAFRKVLRSLRKEYVSFRSYKAVSGKCATCAKLKCLIEHYRRSGRPRADVENLRSRLKAHYNFLVRPERTAYHRSRTMAAENRCTSMITDGMDSAKLALPRVPTEMQASIAGVLKFRVQGILVHSVKKFFYLLSPEIPSDADTAISCLADALQRTKAAGKLHSSLHLQIDGGSENASKTMIAFLSHVVALGLVKRVVVSRLVVGHTHEDIDALFGTIWRGIRCETIDTLEDAVHQLKVRSWLAGL
eukprot:scaffold1954_cov268-Pinguiococcus_pyrenoidosus.AAC.2